MKPKKISQAAKDLANEFDKANCVSSILVDDEGEPVFAWAWGKDIVVSKIDLSDTKKTK